MADAKPVPVILLCAASGTRLTTISRSLREPNPLLRVRDLEAEACAAQGVSSMRELIKLPRKVLYDTWGATCGGILDEVMRDGSTHPVLISLHLTWYKPDTGEFFSPINLLELNRAGCSIVHIVILIDDIYDMFYRLSGPDELYSEEFMSHDRSTLKRLTDRMSDEGLQIQATEIALGELLSWRRAEMIQAENMARSLGSQLTVLGIKHDRRALQAIVSNPDATRIYLSHRISEHRRHNTGTVTQDRPLGQWIPVVEEVNELHHLFLDHHQVLINPTAIDELRFKKTNPEGRRYPLLGSRWPMPEPTERLLCEVPETSGDGGSVANDEQACDYEHTTILAADLPKIHPVSFSVSRSLANRVLLEIPFRDHVIVENTPNLCVYRPFFCRDLETAGSEADWSSGVRPEVNHWLETQPFPGQTTASYSKVRRAAFVHTRLEMKCRFQWLLQDPNWGRFLENVRKPLRKNWKRLGISEDEIDGLFANHIPEVKPNPLDRHPDESVARTKSESVFKAIRTAVQTALHLTFTSLERPSEQPSDEKETPITLGQVALYAIDEGADRGAERMASLVSGLRSFFAEDLDATQVERLNHGFWGDCERCFEQCFEPHERVALDRFVSQHLKVPYDELEQLAGEGDSA